MTRIRGVVVGVGNMGRHHARVIAEAADVDLLAVVDLDHGASRQAASRFGCEAHEHIQTVPDFDFAVVAVPTPHHESVARDVMGRGAAVLIEKPLASSVDACDRLSRDAEQAGVLLCVGHVERHNQAIRILRQRLRDVRLLQFERLSPRAECTSDSVVMDLMVHDLDLACYLAGEEPMWVGSGGGTAYSESLDYASAQLVFPSGCLAVLTASRITHDKIRRVAASTPTEFLVADSLRQEVVAKRETTVEFPDETDAWYRQASVVEIPRLGMGAEPLKVQMAEFLRALEGEQAAVVSAAEGTLAVRLALEIERDARRSGVALPSG